MAEKGQMLQPFLAVESDLVHVHSTVFREVFHILGKGSSWEFDLLPPALFPRTVPEQKTIPSRVRVDVLSAACSWLPSLFASKSSNSVHPFVWCISDKLHWENGGSGSSGEGAQQENCSWTKGFWKCSLGNDLLQWLCKPESTLRS